MRGYAEALHCTRKHLLLAKTHIFETLQKLYRECKEGKCSLSKATRIELEEAVRNLAAAEEHIGDVIKQKPVEELRSLMDKVRKIRQALSMTGIPYRADVPVEDRSVDVLEKALGEVDSLIDEVDKYAMEMKQELSGVECPTCREDIEFAEALVTALTPSPSAKLSYMSREEIEEQIRCLVECFDVPPPVLDYGEDGKCEAWYDTGKKRLHITRGCEPKQLYHEWFHHMANLKGRARPTLLHELEAEVFASLMEEYPLCKCNEKSIKGERLHYTPVKDMRLEEIGKLYGALIVGKYAPAVYEKIDEIVGVAGAPMLRKPSTWLTLAAAIGIPYMSIQGKLPGDWELPLIVFGARNLEHLLDALAEAGVIGVASPPAVGVPPVPAYIPRKKASFA